MDGRVTDSGAALYPAWRIAVLAVLVLLALVPVTLPVSVLRELVQDRFQVSELATSLFMSINMMGAVLAAPLGGMLADRFGRRPDWIAGALALDALCFVALTQVESFGLLLAVRFVEGCAHIFALSLLLALAAAARPEQQRGRVMGLAGGALLLGVAIGAPLGGVIGRVDPVRPLWAGAALLLVAAPLARIGLRETGASEGRRPGLQEIVQMVRADRMLLAPLAFAFADRFTVGFFTTTFPLYLRRIHDLPSAQIGVLISVFMLPFALLSVPFGRLTERVSRAALLCGGSLVYGIGTASLTWWSPDALPFVMAAIGASAAVMFVPSLVMTTQLTPGAARSTALGAFNAAGSLGFIIGPIAGGLVSQSVAAGAFGIAGGWDAGYRAAFLVAGGSEVLLAFIAFPLLRRRETGDT